MPVSRIDERFAMQMVEACEIGLEQILGCYAEVVKREYPNAVSCIVGRKLSTFRCPDCGCHHSRYQEDTVGVLRVIVHVCNECNSSIVSVPLAHSSARNVIMHLDGLRKCLIRLNASNRPDTEGLELVDGLGFPEKFFTLRQKEPTQLNLKDTKQRQKKLPLQLYDSRGINHP